MGTGYGADYHTPWKYAGGGVKTGTHPADYRRDWAQNSIPLCGRLSGGRGTYRRGNPPQ